MKKVGRNGSSIEFTCKHYKSESFKKNRSKCSKS